MAVGKIRKLGKTVNSVNQPNLFKPTLETVPSVSESGIYDFDIISVTYKPDKDILVLYGTPSRTNESGLVEVFKNIPICVSAKYAYDEVTPVEDLFDAFGLDIEQDVDLNSFIGKKVSVYINVAEDVRTGRTFWNGEAFGSL